MGVADLVTVCIHTLNALVHVVVGAWLAPRLRLDLPSWGTQLARWGAVVFFAIAALNEIELAIAVARGARETTWWRMLLPFLQVGAGATFTFFAARHVAVASYSRTYYENMLKGQIDLIDSAMRSRINGVATDDEWTHRLREAIDHDQMRMVFQPIRNLRTGEIVGYEALTRFASSIGISTEQWFVAAQHYGMIGELELVTMRKAIAELENLPGDAYLTINLSQDSLLSASTAMELADMATTHRCVFELTEHVAVFDYQPLVNALRSVRRYGVRLAVDDVGAGYTALRRIVELRPEIIKIDRSLIGHIVDSEHERAIVRALKEFANEIDCAVVVEGIETQEQVDAVLSLGIRFGQGYYLGRPEPM